MRSILIHADAGAAMETRLQAGLDVARAVEGHVNLHINTPLQRFVAMDPFGGAYLSAEAMAAARARDETLAGELTERMGEEDVSWNIESSDVELVDALVSSARLNDLIVVTLAAPLDEDVGSGFPVGTLALNARSPVLAIPSDRRGFTLAGRACVAWDGSYEAANALRAAVPMLMLADQVDLVTITDASGKKGKSDGFPATEALRYLGHYGIKPELHEHEKSHPTTEETLEAVFIALQADWVVMGAYGHARWRETMFGGVTRYFLDAARFPLLLVH
jgi:nucleotide-binding universal stress UspA family protein